MRIYAAVGALLGWFALGLQLYLMLDVVSGLGMVAEAITFFSFFTILTNILVALVFTAVAFDLEGDWGRWFSSPSVQAATFVFIAIVGIAYHLLLAQLWNPRGAQLLADTLLHTVMPLAYILYWLLFAPRTGLSWRNAFGWLAYPAVYLVYTMARGAISGIYPYPFVNAKVLGYGGVALNAVGFLLAFLGTGLLVVAVGRGVRPVHKAKAED